MDPSPDVDRERVELSRRAYEAMAASLDPSPPNLIPSFRIWHYPAAGPQLSWVVFQARADDPLDQVPRVRCVRWDRDADLERLALAHKRRRNPAPSIRISEADLDPKILAEHVAKVKAFSAPRSSMGHPYLSDHHPEFGLEGFDVEGNDGWPIVRIEWERDPDLTLSRLAKWAEGVRSWLRGVLS